MTKMREFYTKAISKLELQIESDSSLQDALEREKKRVEGEFSKSQAAE